MNSHLSVAFLYGNVEIANAGISSPHLKGTFSIHARKAGTGYLNLDSVLNSTKKPDMIKFQEIINWLKINNTLYKDAQPINLKQFYSRIDPTNAPNSDVIGIAQIPNDIAEPQVKEYCKLPIVLPDDNGNSTIKYFEVEDVLALCFPMLFPFGKVPKIPGKTLREKAAVLFASHEFYRCGRLQCSLILFFYNSIMAANASFLQNQISAQRISLPRGASREIPSNLKNMDDPTQPGFWYRKQSHVRAMCATKGDPDLMVTFTFVNKWPEVKETEENIRRLNYDSMDIRFCPFEEMWIWKQRFNEFKCDGFKDLIKKMGFGEVEEYCWRLEFQARGAPYVHALIWLRYRLTLNIISRHFFARIPDEKFCPKLHKLVTSSMIHGCTLARCKKGVETAACKYGFPKPSCKEIHVDNDGNLVIPRDDNECRVIEYSPYFLLKWGGHCHIHILRNSDHLNCSPNAIHYIVKYNFKCEPSLRIQMTDGSTPYQTAFHARIVSSEEAVTKIVHTDYFGSSMASIYIPIKSPERRQAAFRNGMQIQMSWIDKYFHRPRSLERINILTFFSLYNVSASSFSNSAYINDLHNIYGPNASQYIDIPNRIKRPPNTLVPDSNWEQENFGNVIYTVSDTLYPDSKLPDAKVLKCTLRMKPQIVLTDRFSVSSSIEEFCYFYILLNGTWRSDEEMKSDQDSWQKALVYHGLSVPEIDSVYQYYCKLIEFMLTSPMYNEYDFIRNISMMNFDMIPFLSTIKEKVCIENKIKIERVIAELKLLRTIDNEIVYDIDNEESAQNINYYIHFSWNDNEINRAQVKLNESIKLFNLDQAYAFNQIKERILAKIQLMAFVQGKAGTGKSFLIGSIINFLITNKIPYVVCASTGIAASLIGGKTVHSAFGLFTKHDDNKVICSLDVSRPNGFAMTHVQVIIIDEATMMSGDVLNSIEYGLRKIMAQVNSSNRNLMFGGKSILLFGDLAQVPAVTDAPDDFLESLHQFHESESFEGFTKWKLKTIMRQSPDELAFMNLLQNIRNHKDREKIDDESEKIMKGLFIPGKLEDVIHQIDDFVGGDNHKGMVIAFTNRVAQEYNMKILTKRMIAAKSKKIVLQAKFYVNICNHFIGDKEEPIEETRRRQRYMTDLQIASEQDIKTFCGAMKKGMVNTIIPFHLEVIAGARVMLLQNLDVHSGLINGSIGTVVDYFEDVDALSIRFDVQGNEEAPIIITRKKSVEYQINKGKTIFMYQFPLKLSWAVTAHKSQGQTLEKAAIHIGGPAFAHGSFYVALSRVKSLENVKLFGLDNWPDGGPSFHMNPFIQSKENEQFENDF